MMESIAAASMSMSQAQLATAYDTAIRSRWTVWRVRRKP